MKICPKCGNTKFAVTAHFTQSWIVDENGNYIKTLQECEEVTHKPDDDDIWTCSQCGYDAAGIKFNK